MRTHSSLQIDNSYGDWTVECRVCHNPHYQKQVRTYGSSSYLYFGESTDVTTNEITETGAGWTVDEYKDLVVLPNASAVGYNYKILGNTEDTLTVKGPIDLSMAEAGNTFAIVYGKLIREKVNLDDITGLSKTGYRTVKFFNNEGSNSFADGDTTYDGICEVCHDQTTYHKNDGSGSSHHSGTDCADCHDHVYGFAHGAGSWGTIKCIQCHGHDAGSHYDPDSQAPYTPGVAASQGKGSYVSHSTHTETDSDDLRGPGIYCDSCHDIGNFPYFKSGTDGDGDGKYNLSETDVCDTCHSSGGTYDGVDDVALGAKNNWSEVGSSTSLIYAADGSLQSGKEKWCATCHDEAPSVIQGVSAPNVIGDEDNSEGEGIYGAWGYYKTGHGLDSGDFYPSSGNVVSGADKECGDCHDFSLAHIDGESRSYGDGDVKGLDPGIYRQGYRLKMIGGQEPMWIPKPTNTGNTVDHYRVCFQVGCHNFGPAFTDSANMDTNMVTPDIETNSVPVNRHAYHLNSNNDDIFAGDWTGTKNSRMTCVSCHNVHGSTQLAMIRDGKLIDHEPGQRIWYKNDAVTYIASVSTNPPVPEDLPFSASDGKAWDSGSAVNLCAHCHPSNNFIATNDRTPYQDVEQAPTLAWTGTNGLTADGVAPDSGVGNSTFTFRVSYSDINNDSPNPIEVWIDLDDNGSYKVGEKLTMSETDTLDTNLVDGKIYSKSFVIPKAGDGVLNYSFSASDGIFTASGDPTGDKTVTITNNSPVLSWTGEDQYKEDGVNPDTGGDDQDYEFRVSYIDADNDAPVSIQVLIDRNDDGDYLDSGEVQSMSKVGGTSDYVNGEIYTVTLTLDHDLSLNDTIHNYRFQANDGIDGAVGSPTSDSTVTVLANANNPPFLEWVDGTCRTEGVKPSYGAIDADFEFYVKYTDPDGDCPTGTGFVKVTIDGSKYDMSAVDGDSDCSDGKFYSYTTSVTTAGTFNYSFSAQDDGGAGAYGDPTLTSTYEVEVVDALKVRTTAGTGWYTSIQDAVDAVDGEHTILVYDGTYNETIELNNLDSDTTIRSVCGPDLTIINGSGNGSTVTFNRYGSRNLLDGFQVTGGETGISILGTEATINNCRVHGNNRIASTYSAGIYVGQNGTYPTLTLTNSEIYNNTSDRGAGVQIWRGTGHIIDNSIIRNNTATGDSLADGGGGLHIFQVNEITISNSIIEDNESVNYPGGGLFVSQVPDNYSLNTGLTIEDSIIRNNTTDVNGGGVLSDLSKIYFIRSSITGNTAEDVGDFPYVGGGAYSQPSASNFVSFVNCIVADNQSKQAGMAYLNGGDLEIINSTIVNNQATLFTGGAIYSNPNTDPAIINIRNSILWGNQAKTHGHIGTFSNGPVTITDSIIQNGDDGDFINAPFFIGSVTPTVSGFTSEDDPWFVGNGNYHIQVFSPAIDQATSTGAPSDDIDGDARPRVSGYDMGADEYVPDNAQPTLAWTGETNYDSDGVNPDSDFGESSFEFRVKYADSDNEAPAVIQVWVDEDDSSTYESGEKYVMTIEGGDSDYTNGEIYTKTLGINFAGDGDINYRFYASDGIEAAVGIPESDRIVTVTNNVPVMGWTGESNYEGDGVNPDSDVRSSSFEFRVSYTDADNDASDIMQVWVDEDDDGAYQSDEKYDMTETDGGDTDFSDGKLYTKTLTLSYAGNGVITYLFYSSDGTDYATGAPTSDHTVTVE